MKYTQAILVIWMAAISACADTEDVTQTVVLVEAEDALKLQTQRLRVRIWGSTGRGEGDFAERRDITLPQPDLPIVWPLRVPLTPLDKDPNRVYRVRAEMLTDTAEDPITAVEAVSGYKGGQSLQLRLLAQDSCIGLVCEIGKTCEDGACVDSTVSADGLDGYNGGMPQDSAMPDTPTVSISAYLKPPVAEANHGFGRSVAIDDDTIVVGSNTSAYVFVRGADGWMQQGELSGDSAAVSVSISGNTAVVGRSYIGAGEVEVYVRTGDSWSQQDQLVASNSDDGDLFGFSVGIDGDVTVVGALHEDSFATTVDGDELDNSKEDAGAAYVFERSGGEWTQVAYLKTDTGKTFGHSVDIEGDTIVVASAAPTASTVFVRSDGTWTENGRLHLECEGFWEPFCDATWYDTSLSGNMVVLAGDVVDERGSPVTVFDRGSGSWEKQFSPSWEYAAGDFGSKVALSANLMVVGDPGDNSKSEGVNAVYDDERVVDNSGAAHLYYRSAEVWMELAYLKHEDPDTWDKFGQSVAVYENTVVVGVDDDSNGTGVTGDPSNNGASRSGAVYVYEVTP